MASAWEYKVITQKHKGAWALTETPDDSELVAALNREGSQGWELVNALISGTKRAVTLYFKRPR